MGGQLVPVQDTWWRKNKYYVIAACAALAGGTAAYQVYQSNSLAAAHAGLRKALQTARKYNDVCSSTADALSVLSADLSEFLQSDSDEIPQSLRQLAKLAQCPDIQAAITATTASAVQGAASVICASPGEAQLPIIDRIIEAFLSDRGRSLVSLAVGAAARSSTDAFCDAVKASVLQGLFNQPPNSSSSQYGRTPSPAAGAAIHSMLLTPSCSPARQANRHQQQSSQQQQQQQQGQAPVQFILADLLSLFTSPQAQQLMVHLTETSIRTAVGTYCERSNPQGMFEPLIAAISQPDHKRALIDILTAVSSSFCREMAAACMAPAATVASSLSPPSPSRPLSAAAAGLLEELPARASTSASLLTSSLQQCRRRLGKAPLEAGASSSSDSESGSPPSTPRSGPGTPEVAGLGSPVARGAFAAGSSSNPSSVHSEAAGVLAAGGTQRHTAVVQRPSEGLVATLGPMSSVISLLVQASRRQELRSLLVEVTTSSTREFVTTVMPSQLRGLGAAGAPLYNATFKLVLYRVYVLLNVLLFLAVYALSPRVITMAPGN